MRRPIPVAAIAVLLAIGGTVVGTPDLAMATTLDIGTPAAAPAALQPADPDVAIGPSGAQVLVFTGRADGGYGVFSRSRSRAGGPWGAPIRVSATSSSRPLRPAVAVAPSGAAVVVWRAPGAAVLSALRPGPTAAWIRLPVARDGTGFDSPDVTLGPSVATAAWGEGSGASRRARVATLDVASRQWATGATVAIDGPPAIAVGAGGDVGATWSAAVGSPAPGAVRASLLPAGSGVWQPPALLTMSGAAPAIAVAANGAAIVAWQEAGGTPGTPSADTRIRAAIQPVGAPGWSAPEELGTGSYPATRAAINSAGDAVVTWLGSGATELDMRRRSGADGTWGPLVAVGGSEGSGGLGAPVALDDLGNAFIAWIDPEGPGSATLYGWVAPRPTPAPLRAVSADVGGNGEQLALAISGTGDALLASTRSLAVGEPGLGTDLVAGPLRAASCLVPAPDRTSTTGTITLSAAQLRINQRISAAGVRRANAIEVWLGARVETRDICGGGIVASVLGPGLESGPPATARPQFGPNPRELRIAPPVAKTDVTFTLSAVQLRINQRIASRVVRHANALTDRLDRGLSGGDLAPGAITPETLSPTIALTRALPAIAPPPTRTALPPAQTTPGVTFTLSIAQLRINQRISQAAILRLNALRRRLATGLTASDLRNATITASAISPGSVPTP